MGLSASQARLLSITARLTHNETESQLITNSKLRLSDKSAEASEDYIEALNSTQYVYSYYDSTGSKSYYDLTVGTVTQFSEIKNQYGFVDAQGRLLVSATDAANFEDSDTLLDFLDCYGVDIYVEDDADKLTQLYGSDYEHYYDSSNAGTWYNLINSTISGYSAENLYDKNNYNTLSSNITSLLENESYSELLNNSSGIFGNLVSALGSMPEYVENVDYTSFADLKSSYVNDESICYQAVYDSINGTNNSNQSLDTAITHMEHNLSVLLWGNNGIAAYTELDNVTDNGDGTYTITSSDGSISVTSSVAETTSDNCNISDGTWPTNYSSSSQALVTALIEYSDSSDVEALIQDLIDLYCNVAAYLKGINRDDYSDANVTGTTSLSAEDLFSAWEQWYEDLENADTTDSSEYQAYAARQQYEEDIVEWYETVQTLLESFLEHLQEYCGDDLTQGDELHTVADTTDSKYQWYVNLWYRMGGTSATTKASNSQNYYKVLGDEYMYNADWLKFALEHGIVTMEQVQYQEEGESTAEEMNQYAWTSITYTSCSDLTEESDETAIAKAEAEYEQICSEIQIKDKKYDNDLKDLDTEHDALQTEYDSIKSVIEKNVERSFKAFS